MRNKKILFASTVLVFISAACASSPPPQSTPTTTEVPTSTATEEPTATPTEVPPTPTPEFVREFPLEYLQPFFDFLTSEGYKVKPEDWQQGDTEYDFSYEVEACRGPEFSEFGDCVVAQDLCPSTKQCSSRVLTLQYLSTDEVIWPVSDYLLRSAEIRDALTFDIYFLMFVEAQTVSEDFLLSENQALVWNCMVQRPEAARWLPRAVWEVSNELRDVIAKKAEVPTWVPYEGPGHSACIQHVNSN